MIKSHHLKEEQNMPDEKTGGIGGIFKGLENILDLVSELQKKAGESGEGGSNGERNFTTKSGLSGVVGLNIRTNLAGEPRIETFGNVHNTERGPSVEAVREPMVDVLEEENGYTVIAELPGADANTVSAELEGQNLSIAATGAGGRKYAKTITFERAVKKTGLKKQYQNGILEISLPFKKA
jgi:HSP20 family protein